MPPQLTATWAAAYVQVVVVLLVFLLGVPPILKTLDMPLYLRRIRTRRLVITSLSVLAGGLLCAAVVCLFIWTVHPCAASTGARMDWWGGGLVTAALVVSVLVWGLWLVPFRDRREEVVKGRESAALRGGRLISAALADLVHVGERSEPGREKNEVIHVLGRIILILQSDSRYKEHCDAIRPLSRGLEAILLSGSPNSSGSYENYHTCIGILGAALGRVNPKLRSPDSDELVSVLGRVGSMAVKLCIATEAQALAMEVLDQLALFASEQHGGIGRSAMSIMLIGRAAIGVQNYLVCTFALLKLAALCHRKGSSAATSGAVEFVALCAMLWSAAESGHDLTIAMLDGVVSALNTTKGALLCESRKSLAADLDFEAADAVAHMFAFCRS